LTNYTTFGRNFIYEESKRISQRSKKYTLKNRTMSTLKPKFLREYFFSHARRIFSLPSFLKNLLPPTHGLIRNPTLTVFEVNRSVDSVCRLDTTPLRTDRRASGNKVLPKAGLNGFDWAFVQGSTFVLRLNFCAKNPRLRQYPKR